MNGEVACALGGYLSLVLARHPRIDRDELVTNTCSHAWRYRNTFYRNKDRTADAGPSGDAAVRPCFRAWVKKIAGHRLVDMLTAAPKGGDVPEVVDPRPPLGIVELQQADLEKVWAAVVTLCPKLREVIELCYRSESKKRSLNEVGLALGVPKETVRDHHKRAIGILKRKLGVANHE